MKKPTKVTIENFCACVPYEQLESVLGKRRRNQFIKWMYGQTVPIGGVYIWDLERWLNGYPCID